MSKKEKNIIEMQLNNIKEDINNNEIIVKNTEGDPDTKARILIKNKIDYTPKVSVIIPVYNTEKYLRECLDSVINQSLKEIEIICVDDGSTDNSLEILKEYADKDNRITVLTQENLYAGVARNAGMMVASGEYYHFLDSDDWLELEAYKIMFQKIVNEKTDLTICMFNRVIDGNSELVHWSIKTHILPNVNNPISFRDYKDNIFQFCIGYPWDKLYKRDIVVNNKLKFQKLHHSNDTSFVLSYLSLTSNISIILQPLINYRAHEKAISKNKSIQEEAFYYAICGLYENMIKFDKFKDLEQSFLNFVVSFSLWHYNSAEINKNEIIKYLKKLESKFNITNKTQNYFYDKVEFLIFFKLVKNQPKVSILIPIYNNEKYLKECVDSAINQTLHDIEIILLDDGSTDNSVKMCDEYAKQDKRIKVIHKANSGYGATMNVGLDNAIGEYIAILESDDYIEKDMCEKQYELCTQENLDFIKADFKIFVGDGKYRQFVDRRISNNNSFYNKVIKPVDNIAVYKTNNVIWTGIYKNSFLKKNNIRFNETPGASYQDNGFYFQTYSYANRMYFSDNSFYRLRRDNPNSSVKSKEKVFCMCEEMDFIDNFLKEKFPNNQQLEYQSILSRFYNYNFTLDRIDDSFKQMFLERFAKDFKYYLSQNLVNDKFFSKNEINTVKQIVKNPKEYYDIYQIKRLEKDKNDLNSWYRKATGKILNLENPKTLNEKIQWIKLYDSTPIKTRLADKYLAREWIKEQIGEEYLIPLLGVYGKFEEIDFDKLPHKFVIKCNHGCSYNIIVKNKVELDLKDTKNKLDKWMNENYAFRAGYELHYLNIEPKIIIEEYVENVSKNDLVDYKFFCFNGKPKYVYTVYGRESEKSVMATYDMEWKQLDWCLSIHQLEKTKIQKPDNFDLMKEIAEKLSKDFNFVRVDLYLMDNGQIYFGEMTFTPMSGFAKWNKSNIDLELGKMIKLPKIAYNIYTREYYKPKKTNILKKVLKLLNFNQSKYIDCDNVLNTYRIDVKNYGFKDNKVQIIQNENETKAISTEKSNGYGFVGNDNTIEFKIIKSGKLVIDLFNDSGNNTYNQIKLNGKNFLKKPLIIIKNNSYKIKKYVFNKQKFKLEIDCNKKAFKVNVRNVRTSENSIELLNNSSKINISTPAWFSNDKGIGSVLTSQNYKDSFKVKAIGNGNLSFKFMGIDKSFNSERIPLYVNYQSIKINGKEILKEPTIAWHDKAFTYELKVKDGEAIDVEVVKSPYPYTKNELKDLIIKLSNGVEPNDINNIIENIIKSRLEYEKSTKSKQPNKFFSITREKYKTRYYFLGLKYVKFNTRREILDLIKEENAKLRKEIEQLKNRIG